MDMVFILVGITAICGLLGMTELIVQIWEKMEKRSRTVVRRAAYSPAAPAVRNNITRIPLQGGLPDREDIGKIYSLADHFADRFQEIVNS